MGNLVKSKEHIMSFLVSEVILCILRFFGPVDISLKIHSLYEFSLKLEMFGYLIESKSFVLV